MQILQGSDARVHAAHHARSAVIGPTGLSACLRPQCRGCGWCAASASSTTSIAGLALPGTQTAVCSSHAENDVAYQDCQPFCDANEWSDHCSLCKCKACQFCSCSSTFEDDSNERMCEPWCTADYFHDHCSRCKCKACEFCSLGPPCVASGPDDSDYETCESFCAVEFAGSHCSMCKCKACGFCDAAAPNSALAGPTCTSGVEGDVGHEMCQSFCDPATRQEHCSLCKCRGCDFCACSSSHADDATVEMCQPWCSSEEYDTHCDWCACKGCQFCRMGGKKCQSYFLTGDTDHEDCEAFCSEDAKEAHCSYCKAMRSPSATHSPPRPPGAQLKHVHTHTARTPSIAMQRAPSCGTP